MDNITRICRKCGQEKPLSEFVKDKTCALGHGYTCKQCRRERLRKYRAANLEKERERHRKYRAANLEKRREYNRKWRAANPEKERELRRKYHAANPEKERERCRKWNAANPEKRQEYNRKYLEELTDSYLIGQLKKTHLPITPETIDYKRIQLKLYREIKKQTDYERN